MKDAAKRAPAEADALLAQLQSASGRLVFFRVHNNNLRFPFIL